MSILYQQSLKSLAKTIHDHIKELEQDPTLRSSRRWFWELLQNALDLSVDDVPIEILVNYDGQYIEFNHNSQLFDQVSLADLFTINSSKRESNIESQIGNFGTGFLTTHLLSKKVFLSGVYQTLSKKFVKFENVVLDRTGNEKNIKDNLMKFDSNMLKVEQTQEQGQYDPASYFNTSFKYNLQGQNEKETQFQEETAKVGLEDIRNCLPLSMIFIGQLKKIKKITLRIYQEEIIYILEPQIKIKENVYLQSVSINDTKEQFLLVKQYQTQFAIPVQCNLIKKKIKFLKRDPRVPNAYLMFPLIGTEKLNLPFVINSFHFNPAKERNGIIFYGRDQSKVTPNKEKMFQLLNGFEEFITLVQATQKEITWKNIHHLADIQVPDERIEAMDITWFREEIVKPFKHFIFYQKIVQIDKQIFKSLSEIKLPFDKNLDKAKKLCVICKDFYHSKFPDSDLLEQWIRIYQKDEDLWPQNNLLSGIEQIIEDVSQMGYQNIMIAYQQSEMDFVNFFNELIDYLIEEDPRYLKKYSIIPNQSQRLCKSSELLADDNIPEVYKDVLEKFEQSNALRQKLMHHKIKCSEVGQKVDFRKVSHEIQHFLVTHDNQYTIEAGHVALFKLININEPKNILKTQQQLNSFLEYFFIPVQQAKYIEIDAPSLDQVNQKFYSLMFKYMVNNVFFMIQNSKCLNNLSESFQRNFESNKQCEEIIAQMINYTFSQYILNELELNLYIYPNKKGEFINCKQAVRNFNIDKNLLNSFEEILLIFDLQQSFKEHTKVRDSLVSQEFDSRLIPANKSNNCLLKTIMALIEATIKTLKNAQLQKYNKQKKQDRQQIVSIFEPNVVKSLIQLLSLVQFSDEREQNELAQIITIIQCFFRKELSEIKLIPDEKHIMLSEGKHDPIDLKDVYQIIIYNALHIISKQDRLSNLLSVFMLKKAEFFHAYKILIGKIGKLELFFSDKVADWNIFLNYSEFFLKKDRLKFDQNDIQKESKFTPLRLLKAYEELSQLNGYGAKNKSESIFSILLHPQINTEDVKTIFVNMIKTSQIVKEVDTLYSTNYINIDKKQVFQGIECFNTIRQLCDSFIEYEACFDEFKIHQTKMYMHFFGTEEDQKQVFSLLVEDHLVPCYYFSKYFLKYKPMEVVLGNLQIVIELFNKINCSIVVDGQLIQLEEKKQKKSFLVKNIYGNEFLLFSRQELEILERLKEENNKVSVLATFVDEVKNVQESLMVIFDLDFFHQQIVAIQKNQQKKDLMPIYYQTSLKQIKRQQYQDWKQLEQQLLN